MLQDHPSIEDLESFLRLGPYSDVVTQDRRVVRHLLASCDDCQRKLRAIGWDEKRIDRLLHLSGVEEAEKSAYDYIPVFERVEAAINAFFATGRALEQQPEILLAELEAMSAEDLAECITTGSRFVHPTISKRLIESSHAARYEDPGKMLRLAELARLVADACSITIIGSELRLADLRTHAWGHLGNSLRVCGRLREAEQALSLAQRYQKEGTGDPLLHARLLEQVASLHIFQRRFASAIELSDRAGQIHQELGEIHSLASTMVQKAIASLYSGEPESAVAILNQAISLIDQEEDPYLLLAACHNLILSYIDLERPEQALSLYLEVQDLYQGFGDTLILLRTAWQQGRLLRDLGHLHTAEEALLRSRMGFVERDLAYEAAVVSLDLAAVYVQLGEHEALQTTVAATVPIFTALRVSRELLASLLQVQKIAHHKQQALELIGTIATRLERLSKKQPED